MPEFFLPLELYKKKTLDRLSLDDEKGYLNRFITKDRGNGSIFWLYKAWMKKYLPIDDYKKFNFLNRFSLLNEVNIDCRHEAASNLISSLKKERFFIGQFEKEKINQTLKYFSKKQTPIIKPLVPIAIHPKTVIESLDVVEPSVISIECSEKKPKELIFNTPYIWNNHHSIQLEDFQTQLINFLL